MNIRQVATPAELRRFIDLPYRHYKDDPNWVPPLRGEQRRQFHPAGNPMLAHVEYALFLLEAGGRARGRVAAFIDRMALAHWGEPVGLFGSFECIEDREAARLLLDAAAGWLRARGMTRMRGPWSFTSQEWGLVVEGFTPPPVVMGPYNPPWYNDLLAGWGLGKAKDLLVYYIDSAEDYEIPPRYLSLTDRIASRLGLNVRTLDPGRIEEEVARFVAAANESVAENWGFYPVTEAEGRAMARDLRRVLDPETVLFVEDRTGRTVGFAMSIPDVNLILKDLGGRLLPLGWFKLLRGVKRLKQYRMFALGVLPEYHGKAVDALLYRRTYEVLRPRGARLEINYVLEDNAPMNNALRKLGAKPLRRYRVYEKALI